MNTKLKLTRLSAAIFMLALAANICCAQQAPSQKPETVIYKLQKKDFTDHAKALEQSLPQLPGVTVNKFCDKYNKIFLILKVDRTLAPNDDNIVNAINSAGVGYKKVDPTGIQNIVNFCN